MALQDIKRREEDSCGLTVRLLIFPLYGSVGVCSPGGFLLSPWEDSEPLCVDGCLHPNTLIRNVPLLFPVGSEQMVKKAGHGKAILAEWIFFLPTSAQLAAPGWCWSLPRELRTVLTGWAATPAPWPPSSPLSPSWGHLSCLFFTKQCLLNAYDVPGAALRAFGTPVRETDKHTSLASWSLCLRFLFY